MDLGGRATIGGTRGSCRDSCGASWTDGSFGFGGSRTTWSSGGHGGCGGGGGWYGGGSGGCAGAGGGGGSGYVYTSSTAYQYPSGCLLNSSYYLSNASTTGNNRSGNGYATITLVE